MRIKGKTAVWYWAVLIIGNLFILSAFADGKIGIILPVLIFIIYNLIFLPIGVRNYVEITEDRFTIAFGFSTDYINMGEIEEVYRTYNPIASSAASLDRLVIKNSRKEIICSVRDKNKLIEELKKRNSKIKFKL